MLGVHPVAGRNFSDAEDRSHGPKAAILSYSLWRNTFASDPNILGQAILLKGEPFTVIGVLPEGATTPLNADLYTALQLSREGEGEGTNSEAITRLRDGATWEQANDEINRAWSLRTERYELTNNPGANVTYYSVPPQDLGSGFSGSGGWSPSNLGQSGGAPEHQTGGQFVFVAFVRGWVAFDLVQESLESNLGQLLLGHLNRR